MANYVLTRKFSRTTEIFLKHKYRYFIPTISNPEALQKIFEATNSEEYNSIITGEGKLVTIERLSELLQSTTTRGKFTSEIIKENFDIENIGNFLKITYMNTTDFLKNHLRGIQKGEEFARLLDSNGSHNSIINDVNVNNIIISQIKKDKTKKILQNEVDTKLPPELIDNDASSVNIIYNTSQNHSKINPGLSLIQVVDPNLRACLKQSEELSAFFNLINTIDMSMAMPYVNIKFLIPSTIKTNNDQRDYMIASFNNLLFGSKADSTKNSELYTNNAMAISGDFYRNTLTYQQLRSNDSILNVSGNVSDTQQTSTSVGALETISVERKVVDLGIFTSPQTLVNGDETFYGDYNSFDNLDSNTANRITPVGDKFRPFMSIESIDFDVRPSKELMSFKSATINLILYDKSRLNDVLAFIKPDLLGSFSSEILLEYGWHHILGDEEFISPNEISPIGEFINSLKNYEKYQIVNSSYSIQENGQVNITLNISMKGPLDLRGTKVPKQMLDLYILDQDINLYIKQIMNSKFTNKDNKTDYLVLQSDQLSLLEKPSKTNLNDFLTKYTEFKNEIIKASQNEGEKLLLNVTAEKVIATTKKLIKRIDQISGKIDSVLDDGLFNFLQSNDDPFLETSPFMTPSYNSQKFNKNEHVSLGKVLLSILGQLMALTHNYDEVQMVFFNLNEKAIRARHLNIAAIPILKEDFKTYIGDILKFTKQISIEGLVNIILKRYVNEKAAYLYGLNDFLVLNENSNTIYKFEADIQKQQNPSVTTTTQIKEYEASLASEFAKQYGYINKEGIDTILGIEEFDLTFKVPMVKMTFDTLIHPSSDETLILRINFFDEHDNPFESLFDLLNNFQHKKLKNAISTISFLSTEYQNMDSGQPDKMIKIKERFENMVKLLLKENLIKMFDAKNNETRNLKDAIHIKINTTQQDELVKNRSFNSLKTMFKEILPSITFGAPNSAAISSNVSSMQDAKLATVFMTRDEQQSAKGMTYQLLEDANMMPTRVIPSQVSAKIIGCPVINFGQMIFFDFNTGTTIDNAYIVTGIKHSIGPGKFETDLTLTLADSYARFLMNASTIKTFLELARNFKENQKKEKDLQQSGSISATTKQIEVQKQIDEIKNNIGKFLIRILFK